MDARIYEAKVIVYKNTHSRSAAENTARKNTELTNGMRRKNNSLIAATLNELHQQKIDCECLS